MQTQPDVSKLLLTLALTTGFCVNALSPALSADPPGVVVATKTGTKKTLSADELAHLPAVTVTFATEHGQKQASCEGPLLWTILQSIAGLTDKPREQARQSVLVTGRDGYAAVLALGEISPDLEGKQIILAERIDGQALAPEHLRVIVPGDHRGARSVYDVVSISLIDTADDAAQKLR
jgi:DMSO/TMAO reductase YedYZ molybdopterin-dependent catalytic subunit